MSPNPGSVHDDAGNAPAPHAADRTPMGKIAPAGLVGTVIEFYAGPPERPPRSRRWGAPPSSVSCWRSYAA